MNETNTPKAEWIAVDWGTSNLRAWAMADDRPLASVTSDAGMAALAPEQFESTLLGLVGDWLHPTGRTPVVACGMVGARQGWREAGYAAVPCAPGSGNPVRPDVRDPRLDVFILPGLMQNQPADVMRGEETQIAGLLQLSPDFAGLVCLPGTHSKWAEIAAGQVTRFTTFMTGELFALLGRHSVLRHGIAESGWNEDAFAAAVASILDAPARLGADLFGLRAEGLVAGLEPVAARSKLSGLLIGMEIAAMRDGLEPGRPVALIGSAASSSAYAAALASIGVGAALHDAGETTLAGLVAARRALQG